MMKLFPLIALLFFAIPAYAQPDDPCFDKGGMINPETGACEIVETYEISIDYPIEVIDYAFAEEIVDTFISQSRIDFLEQAQEYGLFPDPPWMLAGTYTVNQPKPDLMSISFQMYQYSGGANGFTYPQTFFFDLEAEITLTLSDLFLPDVDGLAVIAQLAEADLVEQAGSIDALYVEGLEPLPENYQNFALSEDTLTIFFAEYQVTAGVFGSPVVEIPLSALTDVLDTRFLP